MTLPSQISLLELNWSDLNPVVSVSLVRRFFWKLLIVCASLGKRLLGMANEVQQARLLVVFDFDHTLVDGNTDTWITKLHPSALPLIHQHRQNGWCWTNIMDKVFTTLHTENFRKQDYIKCFESLEFTAGMKETCYFLQNKGIPAIVISDSNSYFIDHLLQRDFLYDAFCGVYTNPALWDSNGCLRVEHCHAHQCSACPLNLCKTKALQEHLANRCLSYEHIVYVGDGFGDVCPCLTLKQGDYILAREGYKLLKCLQGERSSEVMAEVVPWTSGFDILKLLEKLCT